MLCPRGISRAIDYLQLSAAPNEEDGERPHLEASKAAHLMESL